MEHTTNRTFICSVVFLDIVDYSQQPVDEQIRLKSRFNAILAEAIKGVAVNDRIILDTGDGAAISFLGDPEDALFVALNIRDAILAEGGSSKPRLLVCTGINLGPVKLVQDINGQRNLIGDGINVAQRVMSFAKPGQILVSRSYFEVISRLSQEYARLFHYEGSRADKHVREHQVYSVYPSEKSKGPSHPLQVTPQEELLRETAGDDLAARDADSGGQPGATAKAHVGRTPAHVPSPWQLAWNKISAGWSERFKMLGSQAAKRLNWIALRNNPKALCIAATVIVVAISVPVIVWKMGGEPAKDLDMAPSPTLIIIPETPKKAETPAKMKKAEPPAVAKKADTPEKAQKAETPGAAAKTGVPVKAQKTETAATVSEEQKKTEVATAAEKPSSPATVLLGIAPWGEVYVDGQKKGISPPLNKLQMAPGRHTIEIRNTTFPPYSRTVELKPGEELKIMHKFL